MKFRGELQLGTEFHVCSVQAEIKSRRLTSRSIANYGDSVNCKQRLIYVSNDFAFNALKLTSNNQAQHMDY